MADNNSQPVADFTAEVTQKDLMNFKLYHNYHSVGGVAGFLFGIIALIICVFSIANNLNISYILMMGFFGLFFTVYTPIGMKLKVKSQIKQNPAFNTPIRYIVTPEKITLTMADVTEELAWDDIFRIKCTGRSLVLYVTAVRANIIPLQCIANQMETFIGIAETKLKPFQLKLNKQKVIEQAKKMGNHEEHYDKRDI